MRAERARAQPGGPLDRATLVASDAEEPGLAQDLIRAESLATKQGALIVARCVVPRRHARRHRGAGGAEERSGGLALGGVRHAPTRLTQRARTALGAEVSRGAVAGARCGLESERSPVPERRKEGGINLY